MGETRIHDTPLRITADGAEHGSRLVPTNTVLAVVRGMSLAKEFRVALTKREVAFNQDLKAFTCKPDIDPEFLFYALFARREHIRELATEASHGTKKLETETLAAVEIPVPKLEIQRRVVAMASAYDDLMENNRRRMALLEESARLLYREWFVRLRWAGHERTRITAGVPSGWRKTPLGNITTKIGSGSTPRGGEAAYQTEGVTLIRSMNVYDDRFDDDGLAFIGDEQAAALDNVAVQPRDILLNITGASVARCCMAPERYLPARVNQHVMIIRADPAKADPFFVHAAINSDERKRQLLSYAQKGSTREALTKETISAFAITLPPADLMRQFGEIAEPCFRQRETLALQNQKLRTARDHLLPRLMSGELAV
jgi:type I restriction enzyme S subunit